MGELENTDIISRYSDPHTKEGVIKLKKLYKKNIEDDIKNKEMAIFSICPTYSCNMACTYCYQKSYKKDIDVISKENLEFILAKINDEVRNIRLKKPNIPIVIELFGGEPIQEKNYDAVKQIFSFAQHLDLEVWIVSNGYELIEFSPLFMEYKSIIKQISLTIDGSKEYHNKRRIIKKEKNNISSFEKLMDATDLLLSLGFFVRICTIIDSENINELVKLRDFFYEKGWNKSPRFKFTIGRVYDRLNANKYTKIISEVEILEKVNEIFSADDLTWIVLAFLKTTQELAKSINLDFNQNEFGKSKFHYCWSSSPIIKGYYVGNDKLTYRCITTVANKKYTTGLIEDNNYKSFLDTEWIQNNVFKDEKCLKCFIGGYCGGGCTLEKNIDSKAVCSREKATFNEFMNNLYIKNILKLLDNYKNCKNYK